VALFLVLLWAGYQLPIRQLATQFNRTLEARVSERIRIARELYDTPLQSFQGLLLRFQSASNFSPRVQSKPSSGLITKSNRRLRRSRKDVMRCRVALVGGRDQ
jgi:signal transduction histidine kinase